MLLVGTLVPISAAAQGRCIDCSGCEGRYGSTAGIGWLATGDTVALFFHLSDGEGFGAALLGVWDYPGVAFEVAISYPEDMPDAHRAADEYVLRLADGTEWRDVMSIGRDHITLASDSADAADERSRLAQRLLDGEFAELQLARSGLDLPIRSPLPREGALQAQSVARAASERYRLEGGCR